MTNYIPDEMIFVVIKDGEFYLFRDRKIAETFAVDNSVGRYFSVEQGMPLETMTEEPFHSLN